MVQVFVHHGDLERALRIFRKKVQHEGKARKMKVCCYDKPSIRRARKAAESERRRRKLELKKQRSEL